MTSDVGENTQKIHTERIKYQAKQSSAPESTRKNVSIDMKIEWITEEGGRTQGVEVK